MSQPIQKHTWGQSQWQKYAGVERSQPIHRHTQELRSQWQTDAGVEVGFFGIFFHTQ